MKHKAQFGIEVFGTFMLGLFYFTIGSEQEGMLLGFWVVNLFGLEMTGAHFNPIITLGYMMQSNSQFFEKHKLGIMYFIA